ncbi:hypothetical protein [Caballeronia sp.]|uniref:hypothetical protein n=1 Tax=Caballeronia sp. TaxID=1931223 RepID=UPI003C51F851
MKKMALKGNATTTGGEILDGDETALDNGRPIARHMDLDRFSVQFAANESVDHCSFLRLISSCTWDRHK